MLKEIDDREPLEAIDEFKQARYSYYPRLPDKLTDPVNIIPQVIAYLESENKDWNRDRQRLIDGLKDILKSGTKVYSQNSIIYYGPP